MGAAEQAVNPVQVAPKRKSSRMLRRSPATAAEQALRSLAAVVEQALNPMQLASKKRKIKRKRSRRRKATVVELSRTLAQFAPTA